MVEATGYRSAHLFHNCEPTSATLELFNFYLTVERNYRVEGC